MKLRIILSLCAPVIVGLLLGCEARTDLTPPAGPSSVNTGTASFARFVTIGNSLTAGYQSGSLYKSAQLYAYGNLIAQQVGSTYAMPLYSDPGSPGRLEIQALTATGVTIYTNPNSGSPENLLYPLPYNNLGIPGAFVYDVLKATDSTTCFSAIANPLAPVRNPLFNVVLRGSGTQYKQAKLQAPTMIILWIGNNDILGHATAGGTVPFTPTANFAGLYSQLADSIAALGAKVVVANIPDVTTIPFFTTIGPTLRSSGVPVVWGVRGGTLDTIPMNLTSNYLTLKAQDLLAVGYGQTKAKALPNSVILDSAEVVAVKNTIASYNATIAGIAAVKGFGLVNVNSIFTNIAQNGITENGISFTSAFVLGGLFSLDGVHPTSRGQGVLANEFINVINSKFGASIPLVNVASIPSSLILKKGIGYDKFGLPKIPAGALDNLLF